MNCLQFAVDTLQTFGFSSYEAELSTWDKGASGKYDGSPGSGRWPKARWPKPPRG